MDFHRTITTKSPQETQAVGEKLASSRPKIVCLYGDLGSGKTTFVQGFAKGLGITTRLLSPTFIIVRRYELPSFQKLFYSKRANSRPQGSWMKRPQYPTPKALLKTDQNTMAERSVVFYHIDLYRMQSDKDLGTLGLAEIFADTKAIIAIEWPERLGRLLPKERLDVQFQALDNGQHSIVIC